MPTTYTDQFLVLDPASPPPYGTAMAVEFYTIVDQDSDGLIQASGGDTINAVDVTNSWPGDTVTLNVPGVGNVTYTGVTFYLAVGGPVFTPTDGQVLQAGTLVSTTYVYDSGPLDVRDLGPPCFLPGTRIATPAGMRAIEDLRPGDLIETVDAGPVPLIYAHRRDFGPRDLAARPRMAPVRIARGALGGGLPKRDLYVSPQHRILLRSRIIARMFGAEEVLVPAAHLTDYPGIERQECESVSYIHLVLAQHHVIRSEGAESESLLLGPEAEGSFTQAEMADLMARLAGQKTLPKQPARLLARGPKVRNAVRRHAKNGVALCAPQPVRRAA